MEPITLQEAITVGVTALIVGVLNWWSNRHTKEVKKTLTENNGGSSVKDQLDRMEKRQKRQGKELRDLKGRVNVIETERQKDENVKESD